MHRRRLFVSILAFEFEPAIHHHVTLTYSPAMLSLTRMVPRLCLTPKSRVASSEHLNTNIQTTQHTVPLDSESRKALKFL